MGHLEDGMVSNLAKEEASKAGEHDIHFGYASHQVKQVKSFRAG